LERRLQKIAGGTERLRLRLRLRQDVSWKK
jgi:hypothetical protein